MSRSGIVILVIVVAIVAGGAVFLLKGDGGGKTDVRVTVDSIRNIAELATVEYHVSSYLVRTKKKAWYEWAAAQFLVFVKGTVKGSVDLDQAAIEVNPDPKNRMVKIRVNGVKSLFLTVLCLSGTVLPCPVRFVSFTPLLGA